MEQLRKEELIVERRPVSFEQLVYEKFQEICLSSSYAIKFLIEQINQSKKNKNHSYTLQDFLFDLHKMTEQFTDQIDNVIPLIISIQQYADTETFISSNNKPLLNIVLDQLIEAIKYSLTLQEIELSSEINLNHIIPNQIIENNKSEQLIDEQIDEVQSLPNIGQQFICKTGSNINNSQTLHKTNSNLLSTSKCNSITPINHFIVESSQSTVMDGQKTSQGVKKSQKMNSSRLKRPWDRGSTGILSINYDEQLLQQKLSYQATLQRTEKLLKQHGKCLELLDKCQYRLRNLKKKIYQLRTVKLSEFSKHVQILQIKGDQFVQQQNALTAKTTFCDKTYIKNYLIGQYQVIQKFIGTLRFKHNLNIDRFEQNIENYKVLRIRQQYALENIRALRLVLSLRFKVVGIKQNISYTTKRRLPVSYCQFMVHLILAKFNFKQFMQKVKAVRRSQLIKQYFDNTIKKLTHNYNQKLVQYKKLSKQALNLSYITQIAYLQKGQRQYYIYELTQTLQKIARRSYYVNQRVAKNQLSNSQIAHFNDYLMLVNSKYYHICQKYVKLIQLQLRKRLVMKKQVFQLKSRLNYTYFIYNYLFKKILLQYQKLTLSKYSYFKAQRVLLAKRFYNVQIKVMVIQEREKPSTILKK